MKVFLDCHAHSYFKKSLNASFIALISKKAGAIDTSDFRPISLIGRVYNIIAKVLANRMSSIIEKLSLSLKTLLLKVGKFWIRSS
jgi:hypothetical protein